jgi:hypothetical protein
MTRKELLARLCTAGVFLMPYTLDYLIETRKVERPALDAAGRRIFTESDVESITKLLHFRDRRRR